MIEALIFFPKLSFDTSTKKFTLKLVKYWHVQFIENQRLRFMLGLDYEEKYIHFKTNDYKSELFEFPYIADFKAQIRYTYIYCDIVDYSFIGNYKAKILRIVPNKDFQETENTLHFIYDKPQFHDVLTSNINCIEFELRDEEGKLINFPLGNTLLVLQFRRKRTINNNNNELVEKIVKRMAEEDEEKQRKNKRKKEK